jgi:hypothetical protein
MKNQLPSSEPMAFERRGVPLTVINAVLEAGKLFAKCERYLLASGSTAVQLEPTAHLSPPAESGEPAPEEPPAKDPGVAVQTRELDRRSTGEIQSLVRVRPAAVPRSDIVCAIIAAVGDRVLVMPAGAAAAAQRPLVIEPTASAEEKQAAFFDYFDRDGDGVLSRTETSCMLELVTGSVMTDEVWEIICSPESDPAIGITRAEDMAAYQKPDAPLVDDLIAMVNTGLAKLTPRVRATVTGYDAAADTYMVIDCTVQTSAHECNHTVGWSAAGAAERRVPAAELELDSSFTTKDACEELIKPLVAPYSLSMVELLERAQGSAEIRAALSDPCRLAWSHSASVASSKTPAVALAWATARCSLVWRPCSTRTLGCILSRQW